MATKSMNKIVSLVMLVAALMILSTSMQVVVKGDMTCFEFEVDQTEYPMLFSYHMNPHIDEVNMVVYDKQTRVIDQTGSDINYNSFLHVKFPETGLYPICFEKKSSRDATVHFDIVDEQQKMITAGKQDINKLSKKISEFLIDIRKTGWEFKQVLQQHNRMKAKIEQNQKGNYWVFALKMGVMGVILVIQFFAVKYFFQ